MARLFVSLWIVLFGLTGPVQAANEALTEERVRKFMDSLETVDALGEELAAEGKIEQFDYDAKPQSGEPFRPYSRAAIALKEKFPADYRRLTNTVKPFGFSAETWSATGDRVMIAYLALVMEQEDPRAIEMLEGFDESMLDMMPPEMRPQIEQSFAMLETVKNAPADDKKVVALVKPELDELMEKLEAKAEARVN